VNWNDGKLNVNWCNPQNANSNWRVRTEVSYKTPQIGVLYYEFMNNKNSHDIFDNIISLNNLFFAWREFKEGKLQKIDVRFFKSSLGKNLSEIHNKLKNKTWIPDEYVSFYIRDPKLRNIHKASVRDRVLNQAVFRILYKIFDKSFIFDSYSSRIGKGTHNAVYRLNDFIRKESNNYRSNVFVLKCDVQKFFDSVSHDVLMKLIKNKVSEKNTLWLINKIIKSFKKYPNKGIPLGNVTSQLFANIYLNELDQFMKHKLKVKYYVRYCDDFVILSKDEKYLRNLIKEIDCFLRENLKINLHPSKVTIKKANQGIDFLGYVSFYHYKVLRTKTKKRAFKKIKIRKNQLDKKIISSYSFKQTLNSYLGILKHCKGLKVEKEILKIADIDKVQLILL